MGLIDRFRHGGATGFTMIFMLSGSLSFIPMDLAETHTDSTDSLRAPAMQVNLHDAKTHLSRYVAQALEKEEVVIAKAGRPLVRLVPVQDRSEVRRGGFLQGAAVVRADLKADFAREIDSLCG